MNKRKSVVNFKRFLGTFLTFTQTIRVEIMFINIKL